MPGNSWRAKVPNILLECACVTEMVYSAKEVAQLVAKANTELDAKDARISELTMASQIEATGLRIIAELDDGKLPTGNSDVEEAIKRRIKSLESQLEVAKAAAGPRGIPPLPDHIAALPEIAYEGI